MNSQGSVSRVCSVWLLPLVRDHESRPKAVMQPKRRPDEVLPQPTQAHGSLQRQRCDLLAVGESEGLRKASCRLLCYGPERSYCTAIRAGCVQGCPVGALARLGGGSQGAGWAPAGCWEALEGGREKGFCIAYTPPQSLARLCLWAGSVA